MRGKNTIIINGKVYDAVSGLPVAAPDVISRPHASHDPHKAFSDIGPSVNVHHAPARSATASNGVHKVTQKSATLRRDVLEKPTASTLTPAQRRHHLAGHVAKSPLVKRFNAMVSERPSVSAPAVAPQPKQAETVAPIVHAAHAKVAPRTPHRQERLSSRAVKEKLIAERLAGIDTQKQPEKHKTERKHPRLMSMAAACFALVLIGGYLTYLNMPSLSVRVAATQAGINASFPEYRPDGYRFDGPVAFSQGEVAIKFQANGGPQNFTLHQQGSAWDSQAVLDNLVAEKSGGAYTANSENGLTVYTYGNKAAWVNGGVLYTIDGDAPLSNEQLLKIAASM